MDKINHEKIVRAECGHALLTDFLKKTQKLGILDFAVQREPYEIGVCVREVRQGFALSNTLAADEVKPLTSAFNQSAFA